MEELKKLNGKKVSLKTLEEVECSMHVLSMECLGTPECISDLIGIQSV